MTIGSRLFFGFSIICGLLAVVAGTAAVEASRLDRAVDGIVSFRMPVAETGASIAKEMYSSLAALRGFLLTNRDEFKRDRAAAWEAVAQHTAAMDGLAPRFTNPRNTELWAEARRLLGDLKTAQDKAEAAAPGEAALKILVDEAVPKVHRLEAILYGEAPAGGQRSGGLIRNQKAMLTEASAQAAADSQFLKTVSIGGLLIGLLASAATAFFTRRAIVPPLLDVTRVMGILAGGDLSVAVPGKDRRDELGRMAAALEVFRAGLERQRQLEAEQRAENERRLERGARVAELTRQFDQSASHAVQTVAAAAQQLQGTAQTLSSAATQTSQQASAVSAASDQASANVQTVASAAEELSASITEISRQVAHSAEISRTAAADAANTESVVGELALAVQKIGDVVNLINDIASQTNLLALNATIEAARAGEAGKGFAVVANEVKNLANQTGKATDEIGQQISSVQEQTARVVTTIQEIVKVIEEMGEISGGVAAAVEEQSAATREIARNVEQAAAGTAEVSSNVMGVQSAATQTGGASHEVLTASRDLAGEATGLRTLIETFLQQVRTA